MEAFDKTICSSPEMTTVEEADAVWKAIDSIFVRREAIHKSKTKTTAQEANAVAACKTTFKMMGTINKTMRSPKAQEATVEVIEKRVESIEEMRMAEIEKVRASNLERKEAFADIRRKIDSMTQEDWDRIPRAAPVNYNFDSR